MLEIDNLTIKVENFHIVKNVSLSVKKGEILGVIGESGSGKSITALSVLKLIPENLKVSGTVKINGENIYQLKDKEFNKKIRWKTVSIIFQDPSASLNPLLTIGEQIKEAIIFHEGKRKNLKDKVINLLSEAEIKEPEVVYRSYPHHLSGGMKQRVAIAMALSCNPDFIIADEPTTALDKQTEHKILKLLKNVSKKRNTGIIFISHDIEVIEKIADTITVMYSGFVMESGKTREVIKKPFHPYTKGLIECVPKVEGKGKRKLPVIPGNVPDIKSRPSGCPFHPRCSKRKEICNKELPPLKQIEKRTVRCFFPEC